jgi:putative FmdB family regulatory protein
MPLYEYRCSKCGRTFERIQKFSDKPAAKCPECGGRSKRLLSAPAIHFKGTGWYVTDYARKGQTDPEKAEEKKAEEKKAEKKKDKKTDSAKGTSKDSPKKKTAKKN